MAVNRFNLPDPGEGLLEAEIVTWRVKPGDTVKVNDVVVEIETAKSLVELPIPWAGTVGELLVAEGDTVDVGSPIITIDDGQGGGEAGGDGASGAGAGAATGGGDAEPAEGERVPVLVGYGPRTGAAKRRPRKGAAPAESVAPATASAPAPADAPAPAAAAAASPAPAPAAAATPAPAPAPESPARSGERPLAKPPTRRYAKDHGVDLADVAGTGADGLITREDVDAYLAGGPAGGATESSPSTTAASTAAGTGLGWGDGPREVREPVKGVRKMTASAMVSSAFTAPHVTEFVTVDCTATMELVERLKADREFAGVKVSPLLVLARALIIALRRNPGINATWDESAQEIIYKSYVNLGIAAATPRGLLVPNIKDAQRMNLRELAEALGALVATARDGRTQPADMSGGTITITNVGVFGVDTGTPIINPGESAILAFGAVRRMPWVVTGADGVESIVPRSVTQLALSFDHRLIDGELGSRFLADVAALLEDPARALVWG